MKKKRKIPDNMPRLDFMPEPVTLPQWNAGNIINMVAKGRKNLSAEEVEIIAAVVLLVKNNLEPDDYEIIFRMLSNSKLLLNYQPVPPPKKSSTTRSNRVTIQQDKFDDEDYLPFSFDIDQTDE